MYILTPQAESSPLTQELRNAIAVLRNISQQVVLSLEADWILASF